MASGNLKIDLNAIARNWRALDAMSAGDVETAAVVKADAYGLGIGPVAKTLAKAGAHTFFVATAEEGAAARVALGNDAIINVFSGHMAGDTTTIRDFHLVPMVNSIEQLTRHLENLPSFQFGIQLDSGMNRLGMEPHEWSAVASLALSSDPTLIMSHLACADDPAHPQNADQLSQFRAITAGLDVPLSLAATGGTLLGPAFHFSMTRPGVGLYGGFPYSDAQAVVRLSLPVIQTREVAVGETVGYSASWRAERPSKIATLSAGYADGITRALSNAAILYAGDIPCPLAGRVSMDLLTVDVSHLDQVPSHLDLLCPAQTVDQVAELGGTIGYEILTSLGHRYERQYSGQE
ncbi:MAG: alanine racemase [Paracoccaceae bacterium]|nr:alanine racemase [Paracoccaceae bacterium]